MADEPHTLALPEFSTSLTGFGQAVSLEGRLLECK
jgi:hypothetical protein